jgi:hypothetical protein
MGFGQPGQLPGDLQLPAKVAIDYDNLRFFQKYVHPDFQAEYLVLVTSQFGPRLVSAFAFGRQKGAAYPTDAELMQRVEERRGVSTARRRLRRPPLPVSPRRPSSHCGDCMVVAAAAVVAAALGAAPPTVTACCRSFFDACASAGRRRAAAGGRVPGADWWATTSTVPTPRAAQARPSRGDECAHRSGDELCFRCHDLRLDKAYISRSPRVAAWSVTIRTARATRRYWFRRPTVSASIVTSRPR